MDDMRFVDCRLLPHCYFDGGICDGNDRCRECSRHQKLPPKKIERETETWDGVSYLTYPVCPTCGEMAHGTRCDCCGQEFLMTEDLQKHLEPPEIIKTDCPECGGKNTLVCSKKGTFFSAKCEQCGLTIIT